MAQDESPTARALLTLELIQNSPGITAERLARRLGVSDRAARRYVAILREAGIPLESTPGRYGGYRTGRGLRLPPLMFTASEALGLVMAVLEGRGAAGQTDPVGSAVGKLVRVLPAPLADAVEAVRRVSGRGQQARDAGADPGTTATLAQACAAGRRLRLAYRLPPDRHRDMDVDPWAVVVRNGRWYLLCWSHTSDARRVLRVDRVGTVEVREEPVEVPPPDGLDPVRVLEEHLSEGWTHQVEVLIDAPAAVAARWVPPQLGRLEPIDATHTRLLGSTDELEWYAEHLARVAAPFRVVGPPGLRRAVAELGRRLVRAGTDVAEG